MMFILTLPTVIGAKHWFCVNTQVELNVGAGLYACTDVSTIHVHFQIEQDMTMLMGSCIADPKIAFMQQWTTVYVPAILSNAEKRRRVSRLMNKAGTLGSQLV